MKNMKKTISRHALSLYSLLIVFTGVVFFIFQLYDSAMFILVIWELLLTFYIASEEDRLPEARQTICDLQKRNMDLQKRNVDLQKTVEQDKVSKNFMSNYISELEKLIVDDVRAAKKNKKRSRRKMRKGKK